MDWQTRERYDRKLEMAQRMRDEPSPPEAAFWAGRKHLGTRVVRQAVLFGYIADFYLPSLRAIVEIDGHQHDAQYDYDRRRDRVFAEHGYSVLRLSAEAMLRQPALALEVAAYFAGDLEERRWFAPVVTRAWAELTEDGREIRTRIGESVEHYAPGTWHAELDCPFRRAAS